MEMHPLTRAVTATVIPAGNTLELPIGTIVQVVQSLGGNVTVRTDRGLFRIAAADASAIQGFSATAQETTGHQEFSEQAVWDALRTCFDPEIPINIVDLGLIYDLAVEKAADGKNRIEVKMTLTAPGCGMGPVIAEDARQKIQALPDVGEAKVHIVWDPVWTPQMISPEGRKKLGLE
ncbi:putative Fe-S cluster assembly protein SufT [Nibricoccus sp. IMCC34717]|uniref:putative Fe-S cluster assembly protein SufT n=1 Tax=Nibricoccus sp. IMCC34717 TaxID=3034021 RepID=UPI00384D8485